MFMENEEETRYYKLSTTQQLLLACMAGCLRPGVFTNIASGSGDPAQ